MLRLPLLVFLVHMVGAQVPDLLSNVVLPGAPPGWFAPGSSGYCDNEQAGGFKEARYTCSIRELKKQGYNEEQAKALLKAGTQRTNNPLGQVRNGGTNIPWFHMQRMCKVANECDCSLLFDWCKQPAIPPEDNEYDDLCGQDQKQCIEDALYEDFRVSPRSKAAEAAEQLAKNQGRSPSPRAPSRQRIWSRKLLAQCAAALKCGCKKKYGCTKRFWSGYENAQIKGWGQRE